MRQRLFAVSVAAIIAAPMASGVPALGDASSPREPTPSDVTRPSVAGNIPHSCGANAYPVSGLQRGVEGTTVVQFTITAEGTVKDPSIKTSSGDADLDGAALACTATWLYQPAQKNGAAVAVPWVAQVVWKMGGLLQEPWRSILDDVSLCVASTDAGLREYLTATLHPVVRLSVSHGAVKGATLLASSGNEELDRRTVACFLAVPKEKTATIKDAAEENLALGGYGFSPLTADMVLLVVPTKDELPVSGDGDAASDAVLDCYARFAGPDPKAQGLGAPHLALNARFGTVLRADFAMFAAGAAPMPGVPAATVNRLVCWQGGWVTKLGVPPIEQTQNPEGDAATKRAIAGWRKRRGGRKEPI